jgi:hypothetical protein
MTAPQVAANGRALLAPRQSAAAPGAARQGACRAAGKLRA